MRLDWKILVFLCLLISIVFFKVYYLKTEAKARIEVKAVEPKDSIKPIVYPQNFFDWPLKGDIDLAGNFGEIRTNHFHSGLDIRTNNGQVGVHIFAAGDGYIERINISQNGYGKAIYIRHPNGFTSVYAHLMSFDSKIQDYCEVQQYKNKTSEMEIMPDSGLFAVKKGDFIAYSGNTGGSAGPHLHFEIRDAETSDAHNPLLFGLKLKDDYGPKISFVTLYGLERSNRIQSGTYRQAKYLRSGAGLSSSEITVFPGVYALGASWVDHLRAGGFRMGVPIAKLYLNGKLIFEQNIKRIPFSDWRLVNNYMDHPIAEESHDRIIKLFVDDGNTLKIYPTTINKGKILVEPEKTYRFKLVVKDFPGHKDSIEFILKGSSTADQNFPAERLKITNNEKHKKKVFYPNVVNTFKVRELEQEIYINMPAKVLYDTIEFAMGPSGKYVAGNIIWDVMNSSIPVNDSFELSIKPNLNDTLLGKYVVVRLTGKGAKRAENTLYSDGFLKTKVKLLGQFYVEKDDEAPKILSVIAKANKFSFKTYDRLSGIKEILVQIDGQWILYDYEPKTSLVFGKFPDTVAKGSHEFKIRVTDKKENIKEYSQTIVF